MNIIVKDYEGSDYDGEVFVDVRVKLRKRESQKVSNIDLRTKK